MSSLGGRLISGRVRLLARSRFQSRRSRSLLSLAHRLVVDVRCRRRLVGRVVCLAMLHVLDARAVDVNVSPLSLHLDFQVPSRRCSIAGSSSLSIVVWPCCMLLMLGPWTDDSRPLSCCAVICASSAMFARSRVPRSLFVS